ncbi:HpcH/HpaI aldolase family protein [Planctomicrobium sp. SH664]|uniref:HpcH/HpaI aldolase family protein n=1 Tax=Planctomicrobium sp. SH664 TaxID=3448125 RepID=UPI003F5C287F
MIERTLKQRLAAGERVNVFAIGRAYHPTQLEMYAIHGGFHGFWIDHEHSGFPTQEIEAAATAGRAAGLDSFVRMAPVDYASVTRALESGAGGVMAAQINTAVEADQFVRWSKFAPRGNRGVNGGGYDGRYGNLPIADFCRQANENSMVIIQIETARSVEHVEEIVAVEGVDLLFIGPVDLSQELGVPGEFMHPKCVAAVKRVGEACRKHGKTFGAVVQGVEHTKMMVDHGCRMISPTNDVRTFNAGIASIKKTYAEWF